jgi:hypothetical protein
MTESGQKSNFEWSIFRRSLSGVSVSRVRVRVIHRVLRKIK